MTLAKFPDEYLSTREAGKVLNVALRTAQLWTDSDLIPYSRTPGGHRRIHVAHVDALRLSMMNGKRGRRPSVADYADALREYESDPAGWHAARQPATPAAPVRSPERITLDWMRVNKAWRMTAHQAARNAAGREPIDVGETGYIRRMADVAEHAAFCAGVDAVLAAILGPENAEKH